MMEEHPARLELEKQWFTAADLAGLPGVPGTARNVTSKAKREGWLFQMRKGRGGGREYALTTLPPETRQAILKQQVKEQALVESPPITTPLEQQTVFQLKDWQRTVMDAKLAILRYLDRLITEEGGVNQGIAMLEQLTTDGMLPKRLRSRIPEALGGNKTDLKTRTLKRWRKQYQEGGAAALAPAPRDRSGEPAWGAELVKRYRQPTRLPLTDVLREMDDDGFTPMPKSYDQALRYLKNKVGTVELHRGRVSHGELTAIKPHARRDISDLVPMQILAGDGHSSYALAAHPETGKPYLPEITQIVDIATRKTIGIDFSMTENHIAVCGALQMATRVGGRPAILQWDRGRGAKNKVMEGDITGMSDRVGFAFYHARAYTPQANGVVERNHQTVLIPAAKTLSSYIGRRSKNPDLLREVKKKIRKG
ncbi:MAG: transposase, partial [Magnetococcales bacterium]|nr:transposase [Magnetococcales bacterium]